jgi:spore coat protein A
MNRRRVLSLTGGVGAAAVIGATVPWLASPAETGRLLRSDLPLPAPFRVPLRIPRLLEPRRDGDTDRYEITQRRATVELLPGVLTEIWGYEGEFPGPTIVSRSGRRTVVRHRNLLPVPTVVHLHGGHTPASSDGYPTDLLIPESGLSPDGHASSHHDPRANIRVGNREYEYPVLQRAATLWYHDHRMDFTGPAVWRGLLGLHLVRDDEEEALPLPAGDREIPLVVTDRAFAADGSLRYPSLDPSLLHRHGVPRPYRQGVVGDVILVNGTPWPTLEVDAVRYRFRVLNASNTRRYRIALDPPPPDGSGLVQIGSDGGLLERPISHDRIEIAPAERFDIVVDFSSYPVSRCGTRWAVAPPRTSCSSG